MTYEGDERRKENIQVQKDIAVIKTEIIYLKEMLENADRRHSLCSSRQELEDHKDNLKDHEVRDRFMFGILLIMQGWALVKLYLL